MYYTRPLVCSYGEMIATIIHETFAVLESPQRQIHVRYTHTQRQASKSMYHARPVVCSYGEMITNITHGTFASLARPQRQVHVRYTHTHTKTQRQSSKSMYYARRLACSYGEMIANTTHENFSTLAGPQRQVHDRYTHTHTRRQASKSIYHARPLDAVTSK
jgi:hypothetical protein